MELAQLTLILTLILTPFCIVPRLCSGACQASALDPLGKHTKEKPKLAEPATDHAAVQAWADTAEGDAFGQWINNDDDDIDAHYVHHYQNYTF